MNEYPWLTPYWQQFATALQTGRIAPAMLLQGPQGLGKLRLAESMVASLLCANAKPEACGECRSCHLLRAGNHPDFLQITVENDETIKVDMIRATSRLYKTTTLGQRAVVLICPAENMNRNAANALLKILEEPPAQTHFILVSHRFEALLPTVRSRCQVMPIRCHDENATLVWLRAQNLEQAELALGLNQNAPLAALQFDFQVLQQVLDDCLSLAKNSDDWLSINKRWQDIDFKQLLTYLQHLCHAVACEQMGIAHRFTSQAKMIVQLAKLTTMTRIMQQYCYYSALKQQVLQHPTLNIAMLVDALMEQQRSAA